MTSAPQATVRGVSNLQLWLEHGFTVVRDACESYPSYPQFALREGVENTSSPVRASSPPAVASRSPAATATPIISPPTSHPPSAQPVDTVDDVSRIVRRDIKYGADWIKLMATGGVMDPISDYRVQELSDAQMARAVEDRASRRTQGDGARRRHRRHQGRQFAQASTPSNTAPCSTRKARGLMAERGTWLVPTLYCFQHDLKTGTLERPRTEQHGQGHSHC